MAARVHRSKPEKNRRSWAAPAVAACAAVALVVGATAAVLTFHHTPQAAGEHGTLPASSTHQHPGGTGQQASQPPLRVESTSPAGGAEDVSYAPVVTVELSAPLAAGSPLPQLSPAIAGNWSTDGATTLVFHPDAQFAPWTSVQLTIPGGSSGLREAGGATLASTVSTNFTVEGASELRLQQLLAELGYLPVSFVPEGGAQSLASTSSGATGGTGTSATGSTSDVSPTAAALDAEPTTADEVPLAPASGRFVWRYADTPSLLQELWSPGTANVVTKGAVMAFEAAVGITVDGEPGPAVWSHLLAAVAARQVDSAPYDYIMVSENSPETLYVWQDGSVLFTVYANTGISQAPTALGTYPVYARYLVTTMSGKNPNGTTYKDPGIPHVAYFNGGDAIHGFIRAGYGYPQSLGCVELSYADVAQVWPYDQLGTLVTIY